MSTIRRRLALTLLAAALLLGLGPVGCGRPGVPPPPTPLRLAAAADLQSCLPAMISNYEAEHAIKVDLIFGASGQLAEQIRAGAPFDLFLSANRRFVDDLDRDGLIVKGSARPYAVGSMVLAWGSHAGEPLESLADLDRPQIRKVAIANPALAPYGVAAEQALTKAGLMGTVGPKLIRASNVRQALQYLESGDVEAAIVGRALALPESVDSAEIDPALHDPIVQALGVVSSSRQTDAAGSLASYLLSEAGQAGFRAAGFRAP